jgi:outer membrane protein assembly factor BamB
MKGILLDSGASSEFPASASGNMAVSLFSKVAACLAVLSFPQVSLSLGKTDTITWGGDVSRTGYETTHNLDPQTVSSSDFGNIWTAKLLGNFNGIGAEQVLSQPLVYTTGDGIQYVFVATTQNNLYKINAKTGDVVKSRNIGVPFLTADIGGCNDIFPAVGVSGTGVIDPATGLWYLTSKTYSEPVRTPLFWEAQQY